MVELSEKFSDGFDYKSTGGFRKKIDREKNRRNVSRETLSKENEDKFF